MDDALVNAYKEVLKAYEEATKSMMAVIESQNEIIYTLIKKDEA